MWGTPAVLQELGKIKQLVQSKPDMKQRMFQHFHGALPMDIRVVNVWEHVTVEDLNFTLCKWHCRIARGMR